MDIYLPILGLHKSGYSNIQLLESYGITDAPDNKGSTFQPITDVNPGFQNLLNIISAYFYHREKKYIKAMFFINRLNNPALFECQDNIESLALGIFLKLYDAYYHYTGRDLKRNYDAVCASGLLNLNASRIQGAMCEDEIRTGNFLDDAGNIEEKADCFVDFLLNNRGYPIKGTQRQCAFIYCGVPDEKPLAAYLAGRHPGFKSEANILHGSACTIEIIKANNFNTIAFFLYRDPDRKKKHKKNGKLNRKKIIGIAAIIIPLTLLTIIMGFAVFMNKKDHSDILQIEYTWDNPDALQFIWKQEKTLSKEKKPVIFLFPQDQYGSWIDVYYQNQYFYGKTDRYALKLDFRGPADYSYGGWGIAFDKQDMDISGFQFITFFIKGLGNYTDNKRQIFEFKIKDRHKLELSRQVIVKSGNWEQVRIPLSVFKGIDWQRLDNINFGFNNNLGPVVVCIDEIAFLK